MEEPRGKLMKTNESGPEEEKPVSCRRGAPGNAWQGRINLALRLILGALFIYSGGAKLLNPAAFQGEIANFALLPWRMSGVVAVYLPWLEVACGAALITTCQLGGAILILSSLMVAFIAFVGSAWARGLDVSCGCFGASDAAVNYPLWIGRNLLILTGLVAAAVLRSRIREPEQAEMAAGSAGAGTGSAKRPSP